MTLPEQVAARIAQNHETHHISDVRKLFAETLERPLGPQIHAQAVDDLQRRITLRSSLVSLLLTIVAAVAVFVGSGILLQEFDEKHVAAFLAGPAATTREMSGEGLAPLAAVLADQHSWLGRTQVEFWRGSERVGQFGHAVGFFPATWVKTLGDSEISIRVMRSRWERLLASFAYVIAISVVFTSVILLAVGPLMREIANRRRAQIEAQTALAASEERFKGIASLSADMFWEVDAEGRLAFIVTSGQGRLEQLGGVMEQITGQNVGALLDQLGPTARTGFEKHFAARESFSGLQMDGQTATGPLHLVSNGRPLFDDDGNFTGYQGATRDVTDLVVAQTEANTATNLIQSLFENSPAAIVVKGLDGSFIRKNRTFAAWAGSATTPPTGKAHIGLPVSADEEWFAELDRQVLETVRPVQGERTVTYGDGTKRRLSTVKCPLLDEHGQLTGIGVITSDVTKLHETEERLSRAQKLEAIGQLTGGVAHDFNNLLTVARGNIELLELRIGNDDKARANIAATLRAIDHGAALTQQLLSYARKQALSPSTVDVAKTLEHFGTFLRSVIRENISIAVDASEGLPAIQADQAQLEAALLNLALNAQDAMPGGGILTISASKAIGATDRVDIAVSDNGTGIAEALRDKVLEPFFTTKDVGQGSGLGLSMVYGFVKQSGGDFDLESTPGAGTTVTLSMPLATVGPALEHEDEGSATVQKGKGRVLLVEDNPELRDLAEGMLDSLGYVVDSAADARDATRHLQDCGDYDILFTDLVLPGDVSGLQLAEWATASHPTMRIVITSGYADNVLREGGGLPPHVQFLPKPYQLATISQVLNDELLLDQR